MATPSQEPEHPVTPPPPGHLDEDLDKAKKGWRPNIVEWMYLLAAVVIGWQIVRFYMNH